MGRFDIPMAHGSLVASLILSVPINRQVYCLDGGSRYFGTAASSFTLLGHLISQIDSLSIRQKLLPGCQFTSFDFHFCII